MNYFGTELREAGHYLWNLEGDYFGKCSIDLYKLPFNPESMPYGGHGSLNGKVEYLSIGGYSICAIGGSCIDRRPGCKSVFFFKEQLNKEEIKAKIMAIPAAKRIIEKMPFEIDW